MKRRRFLKYLSGIPFVGSLAALGKSGRPNRQPETLEPGQVWKGKCLTSYVPEGKLEFYYILLSAKSGYAENGIFWWTASEHMRGTNVFFGGRSHQFPEEEIRKLTYLGHITELNNCKS